MAADSCKWNVKINSEFKIPRRLYNKPSIFQETNGNALYSCGIDAHLFPVNCSFITSLIRAIAIPCLLGRDACYGCSAAVIRTRLSVTRSNVSHCWLHVCSTIVSWIIYNYNDSICRACLLLEWMCSAEIQCCLNHVYIQHSFINVKVCSCVMTAQHRIWRYKDNRG